MAEEIKYKKFNRDYKLLAIGLEELKKWVHYDPVTGIFTYLTRRNGTLQANSRTPEGYIQLKIKLEGFAAHRVAYFYMTGQVPNGHIDHINGIKSDNRWENLRVATSSQNSNNARPCYWKKFKGTQKPTTNRKDWIATHSQNGKNQILGLFPTEEQAARAFDRKCLWFHGEYIYTNFPREDYNFDIIEQLKPLRCIEFFDYADNNPCYVNKKLIRQLFEEDSGDYLLFTMVDKDGHWIPETHQIIMRNSYLSSDLPEGYWDFKHIDSFRFNTEYHYDKSVYVK